MRTGNISVSLAFWNGPSNLNHNIKSRVTYQANGKILSSDVDFNEQLESVLNLNESRLVSNRNAALEAVHNILNVRQGTRKKHEISSLLAMILARDITNKRKPFFGFLAHYLESKL